ncbi:translocation protein [Fistulina hepatica ATCC 64428]|uniref:Translocation protein SEC62 n=1 Tax=Fistulina hepatica ATCC 64428 TaxID=1128425 RepID=A0A0D7A939_9AGAR|nr:translocation protein [Fistulina hepatica ATCC 64428]
MIPQEAQAKASPEIKKVAQFLRSGNAGLKVRVGALNGKRLDYFKGKSAVKALLSPGYAKLKNVPKVTSESEAITVLQSVNMHAFFIRVQRGGPSGSSSSSPKTLQIDPQQKVAPDEYFAWFYDGSQWTTYAGGIGLVLLMLAGVMYPLWPHFMRVGAYYVSMGMLGLMGLFIALAIVRLIFYIVTIIVASPGIWIFPKLFADVGFVESFIPLWEWDIPKKKHHKAKKDKSEKDKSKSKGKKKSSAVSDVTSTPVSPASKSSLEPTNGAILEEIPPEMRSQARRIEEVPDEDA